MTNGRQKPNADFLRDHFLREGRLTEQQALTTLRMTTSVLSSEPNVLKGPQPGNRCVATHSSPSFLLDGCRI